MAKRLTAISVEQTKPDPSRRREIPDGLLAGLYLVVQPSGAKSWAVRYRRGRGDGAQPRKLTLGKYPALGLEAARDRARDALQDVARGLDPAAAKRAARDEAGSERNLVSTIVDEFMAKHIGSKRSADEVRRMFDHDVLPHWGKKSIQEISRRDVIELLDRLTDRGVGTMTNRVFSIVRKLFNWALARDIIATSPTAGMRPPVPEVSRDRVLTDDEVVRFWRASGELGYPFGPLFRLLLVTGQRLSEVGDAVAAEINSSDRLWTIPKERAKNNSAHDVPLSDLALGIVEDLPRIERERPPKGPRPSPYLFTTTGETPVSGFSRAKANLDKLMADEEGEPPAEWRLHDLRRTAASGMARLGIHLPVIEKVLNHTSGSFAGIVGVYQRHTFADEKRAALEAWSSFLQRLVEGAAQTNVVELGRARA